jgi:hypothetical protein
LMPSKMIITGYIRRIVASDKIGLAHQVRCLNWCMSKAKVRNGNAAGLFGVILKVALGVHICFITNDLDAVLVGANGTVGTKTVELCTKESFRCNV